MVEQGDARRGGAMLGVMRKAQGGGGLSPGGGVKRGNAY
jgi:hypothetical protein